MTEFLVVIAGPTGAGKSALAVDLAMRIDGEVVNYDSVQVYRGFDIGTAKVSASDRLLAAHHLLDLVTADEEFNAADFEKAAIDVCRGIWSRARTPILVGGTNFYLRALLVGLPPLPPADPVLRARLRRIRERERGRLHLLHWLTRVDPVTAARVAPADRHRIERALEVHLLTGRPISSFEAPTSRAEERFLNCKLAISLPKELLRERIDARVERMYADGLVAETRRLLEKYPRHSRPFSSIGYREAVLVLEGKMDTASAIAETKRRTRAYAKRQLTWLRGERSVHWIAGDVGRSEILRRAIEILSALPERDRKVTGS